MKKTNLILTHIGVASKSRLVFQSALQNPADILDVHRLAVRNSASNSMLSVTLPSAVNEFRRSLSDPAGSQFFKQQGRGQK